MEHMERVSIQDPYICVAADGKRVEFHFSPAHRVATDDEEFLRELVSVISRHLDRRRRAAAMMSPAMLEQPDADPGK